MPPIYLYNGKILVRDNKIGINQNCCCLTPTPTLTPPPTPTPGEPGCSCEATLFSICGVQLDINLNGLFYNDNGQINPLNINLVAVDQGQQQVGLDQFNNPIFVQIARDYFCYLDIEGENVVQKLQLDVSISFGPNWFCDANGNNQVNGMVTFNGIVNFDELECPEEMQPIAIISGRYNLNIMNDPCGNLNGNVSWRMLQAGFDIC